MAHGEFFLLGAYTVVMTDQAGLGFWLGLVLAPDHCRRHWNGDRIYCIRHLYQRVLDTILATWGLSIAIKQLIIILFGPAGLMIKPPLPQMVSFMGIEYPSYRLFIMAVALVTIGLTFYVFLKTDFGLGARAVIDNRDMAAVLGINTRKMYRTTFTFGSALAGLAGAVMAPLMSCDPQMGLGIFYPRLPGDPDRRNRRALRGPGGRRSRGRCGQYHQLHLFSCHRSDRCVFHGDHRDSDSAPRIAGVKERQVIG